MSVIDALNTVHAANIQVVMSYMIAATAKCAMSTVNAARFAGKTLANAVWSATSTLVFAALCPAVAIPTNARTAKSVNHVVSVHAMIAVNIHASVVST